MTCSGVCLLRFIVRPSSPILQGDKSSHKSRTEPTGAGHATAAGTSHSAISRLESGTHTPSLATLQKIAAVLDEELILCFQSTVDGEVEREFAAVA
jgi:DNA-binding XRE family transcriptional regulator